MADFVVERRESAKNGKTYVTVTGEGVDNAMFDLLDAAYAAAGGKGERPDGFGVVWSGIKGMSVTFEAAQFDKHNKPTVKVSAPAVPDDEDVALAKAWAEAIAAGRGKLDDLADWPHIQKMTMTLLRRHKAPPTPPTAPPAPPAPAGKIGAEHGVTVTRRGKRVAAA